MRLKRDNGLIRPAAKHPKPRVRIVIESTGALFEPMYLDTVSFRDRAGLRMLLNECFVQNRVRSPISLDDMTRMVGAAILREVNRKFGLLDPSIGYWEIRVIFEVSHANDFPVDDRGIAYECEAIREVVISSVQP